MKIFYAVQATGNGHISRAMEILPYLEQYGSVDLFLSGNNSNLPVNANVQYRSKGLSLFYSGNGGLSYFDTMKALQPRRIFNEVKNLPVEKYDLVINDFESITAMACAYKKVKSINFGHQASFMSNNTPRPKRKNIIGELVLKNYARASKYVGLHFEQYDDFILPPIIKNDIWAATPKNYGHITVYLLSYTDTSITKSLSPLKDFQFEVFSKEVNQKTCIGNITFIPIDKNEFNKSLINCHGIITGAGFETPAEALYLQKKILVMPVSGHYEQSCNAAALEKLGVQTIKLLDNNFATTFSNWINNYQQKIVHYTKNTEAIVDTMMEYASEINKIPQYNLGQLGFE
ncbi:MAG: glycosyl transferase [Ferruginibacter sp.]|nr:glycosyl transferase [Ferruginibacter sp.]